MLPICGVLRVSASRERRIISRIEESENEEYPSVNGVLPKKDGARTHGTSIVDLDKDLALSRGRYGYLFNLGIGL